MNTERLARDHKSRALENAILAGKNADLAHQNELLAARLAQMDLMLATTVDNPERNGAQVAATRNIDQDCLMPDTEDMKLNEGLQRHAEKEREDKKLNEGLQKLEEEEDGKLSAEKKAAKSIETQVRPTPKSGSAVASTLTPKQTMEDDGAMAQD